jgi:hypothetical protein
MLLRVIRGAIIAMAAWIYLCVVSAEVVGFPNLYCWPLVVIRPEELPQPPAWVVVIDVAAAFLVLGATALVTMWCWRAVAHQIQFRLSTLLGATAILAVVGAIWRAGQDVFWIALSGSETDVLTTSLMFNPTLLLHWQPTWFPPLPLIRLGVLLGLACTIYIAGLCIVMLGTRCLGLTRRVHCAAGPVSE